MAMPRLLPPLLTAVLALGLGFVAHGQTEPAKTATDATVFKDPAKAAAAADAPATTKAARPRRDRVMSDELAATLAVGMPKYTPPKPVEKKQGPAPETEEADKPKNDIVRLPNYVVREKRPPVFTERELATPERKADLAIKIHPGLKFGPLASLNRPIALAMYQEQERLDGMATLADDAATMRRAGDKAGADYIRKQSQQTYIDRDDSWSSYVRGPR